MNLFFKIKKPAACVFDYLIDMQKFASAHPVISKIEQKPNGSYLVFETLKVLGIPISFTYPVLIALYPQHNSVTMRATVLKFTRIEMEFKLSPDGKHTIVDEKIIIRSILPIRSIIEGVFREQHIQLFKNIGKAVCK